MQGCGSGVRGQLYTARYSCASLSISIPLQAFDSVRFGSVAVRSCRVGRFRFSDGAGPPQTCVLVAENRASRFSGTLLGQPELYDAAVGDLATAVS